MSPRTAQRRAFFGDLSAWIDAAPELMGAGGGGVHDLKRRLGIMHPSSWDKLFDEYDTDGNGELELEEFTAVVRLELGIPKYKLSDDELALLFHLVDKDNSGSIECHELKEFIYTGELRKKLRLFSFKTDWENLFEQFSTDEPGDGCKRLTLSEFFCAVRQQEQSFRSSVVSISDQDLVEVFQRSSSESDEAEGKLSWADLERFLQPDNGGERARTARADTLARVSDALRVASYKTDWDDLFEKIDTDGSGSIDYQEFLRAIRMHLQISEYSIADHELEELFRRVSMFFPCTLSKYDDMVLGSRA